MYVQALAEEMIMTTAAQTGLVMPNGAPLRRAPMQGIRFLFHGVPKAGKSSIADTGPVPRLTLDAEDAALWTPSRKIYWNPSRETCPVPDGTWDTCVVIIHDYNELFSLLRILQAGRHPFNSVAMDSVTTIQDRVIRSLAGIRKVERDQWGQLLRIVNNLIGGYGDLVTHPLRPVWAVTFVCGSEYDQNTRKMRPMLQGASQRHVPYVPELEGWVYAAPDGTRHVWSGPSDDYETGNRLWGRLPDDMQLGYPGVVPGWTLESMVSQALGLAA
jgi:hypothetical protein